MYDEIDTVNENILYLKKNNCKVIVIQSDPGNDENEINMKKCDAYEMLPDLAGSKEKYLEMREKDGTGEPYVIGAIAIPRNYNRGFTLTKNMDVDYTVGINGDTKITSLQGIKEIISKMKKEERKIAVTRNVGFLMFNEQGKLNNFQDKTSTQIMPQFFIVDQKYVKKGLFCNTKTTNKYNTEQCMGDEIVRFAKENSKKFFDIVHVISRSPYPRNIQGVIYNPEQVSKMPESIESIFSLIRKHNGKRFNLFLTKVTRIAEKLCK